MKGMVFTEFLTMVEEGFGANMVDDIIDDCSLASNGAYTKVGTYDYNELLALVTALSTRTAVPVPDLVVSYGKHLFRRFYQMMPHFFKNHASSFDFMCSVENIIHVEVRKIYPDAELPRIITEIQDSNHLTITYKSKRPFADFAYGLILGCIEHYHENITVTFEDLTVSDGYCRVFNLIKA